MTLKQIKFNPFKHWEIISDLYKTLSFQKDFGYERIPLDSLFFWTRISILPINQ